MRLSVVVPCFNEEESVARFSSELWPELERLGGEFEVVAVDDGSSDGTLEALRALAARRTGLKIVAHAPNRGLGAALRAGFAAASGERIVALDADLTFHPRLIARLLARQEETGAELVAGSPFLEPGGFSGVPWVRRLPSWLINAFYRGLFGLSLTAYTPIFRLYDAAALKDLPLSSDGFEINAEIAARFLMAKRPCAEAPAELTVRTEGASKLNRARELKRHLALIARLLSEPKAS